MSRPFPDEKRRVLVSKYCARRQVLDGGTEHYLSTAGDGSFGMKHLVDLGDRRVPDGIGAVSAQPGNSEFRIPGLATGIARTVSGCERGCFVEKEKLGVRTRVEYRTVDSVELERAGNPGFPSPGPNDLTRPIMKDASITHERPAHWYSVQLAPGINAIFEWHDKS
jgi:hypothetical protein